MKMFLIASVILHGLIHFSGFGRVWGLINTSGFTTHTLFFVPMPVQKILGLCWLLAVLLLLLTAIMLINGNRHRWIFLLVAILVSQALIIIYWKEAKAGSIVNLLLCIPAAIALGNRHFERSVNKEIAKITSAGIMVQQDSVITEASIKGMPECVQQWLISSGAIGKEKAHIVQLKQKGQIRTDPDRDWLNATAEQAFNLDAPAFVWKVKVNANGLIWYSGMDKLERGSGNMLIKLYSLVPLVNSSGPEIDQGTLLRFLGELCWIPSAATTSYITWEGVGERAAKATLHYNNQSAEGIFTFDTNGNILSFNAKRYMTKDGTSTLEDWYIPCREWAVKGGYKIPVKGNVVWKLKEGDFTYYRWQIEDITYR